jgi:hypothetical protein
MSTAADDPRAALRRTVYLMLIVLSTGAMLGRILAVDSVDAIGLERARMEKIPAQLAEKRQQLEARELSAEQIERELKRAEDQLWRRARLRRPFLSANDRSRWGTLRALVEPEMHVPGAPYAIDKVINQPGWDTIDMVKHDGHLYSSKPPLWPTLMAAEYWLIYHTTGATLGTHPYDVGRFMLVSFNLVPMVIYFLLLARLIERFGTTDWGRVFVMAAAAFGTFLTTFATVLNNHLPAAVCMVITLYAAVRIWFDGERRARYFVIAGLFAGLLVANELPALCISGLLAMALLWKAPRQTLAFFTPAAVLVAAAFFGTNWIGHQSLKPPYMHRNKTNPADNWYDYEYERNGRTYESYWKSPVGVDRGEPRWPVYALHVLVGHHGIFSLTPIWLLSAVGLGLWLRRPADRNLWDLALLISMTSLICLAFYLELLVIGEKDRNYGGMTSGLRWMFWFAPLWLLSMLPALDAMSGRRWLRWLALAMLLVSVVSASYPTWNPWTHPWLMNYLAYLGWINVP